MQSLPVDYDKSGKGLVHWTSSEVGEQLQGVGISILGLVLGNTKTKEECNLLVDHASKEKGKLKGLHDSF